MGKLSNVKYLEEIMKNIEMGELRAEIERLQGKLAEKDAENDFLKDELASQKTPNAIKGLVVVETGDVRYMMHEDFFAKIAGLELE